MRRAVITGVGCVSAAGLYPGAMWSNVLEGVTGLRRIEGFDSTNFPVHVAGEVTVDPAAAVPKRVLLQTDRHTHHGLVAADLALKDAGIEAGQLDPGRIGVVMANSLGGSTFGEDQLAKLYTRGARHVSAYMAIALFYAATVGQISIRHNLKGYAKTPVADRAGGVVALGDALRTVTNGALDVVLAGGCEAPVSPYALTSCIETGLVGHTNGDIAYTPFAGGDGYVIGEGGAVLVIEELQHALRRGVPVYAELVGFGHTFDGRDHIEPSADGTQYARAIRLALDDAGIGPGDVGQVWVEGLGSAAQDERELRALRKVFGDALDGVRLLCTKPLYGHTLAAAGALEAAMAAVAQRERSLPPAAFPGDGLPFIAEAGVAPNKYTVIAATGRGGINAAIVLAPFDEPVLKTVAPPEVEVTGIVTSVLVNASVGETFDYVARTETWPVWQPALEKVTVTPPGRLALGSEISDVRHHMGLRIESTLNVAAFDEDSHVRLQSPGGHTTIDINFAPLDTGTDVRLTIDIDPSALPGFGGSELTSFLERQSEILLASLKDTLESHGELYEALERWLPTRSDSETDSQDS